MSIIPATRNRLAKISTSKAIIAINRLCVHINANTDIKINPAADSKTENTPLYNLYLPTRLPEFFKLFNRQILGVSLRDRAITPAVVILYFGIGPFLA
jgi:hypothetical protein